ncbi:hypothetical protein VNI00_014492 [Paramarasmius palmivorus]|uniref:HMG box domain-containing protein n=1 Tax=Paramarasmius palmivorus TaxID=297713 RepID=A0AAW0BSP4_9AGAR
MARFTGSAKKWKIAKPNQRQRIRKQPTKKKKRVPSTVEERRKALKEQKETRQKMNNAIREVGSYVRAKCLELAHDYKRKPRYFEDRIYNGGVKMVRQRNKINAFNAFKSLKAKENEKAGGKKLSAAELGSQLKTEYKALTKEEKEELVKKFADLRSTEVVVPSIMGRSISQEAAHLLSNIVGLIKSMSVRVGVEAILLVTRNRPEPFMEPYWFISNQAYGDYLATIAKQKFDYMAIGEKMQSFAIAKCDVANLASSANTKVRALKSVIRETMRSQVEECKRQRGTLDDGKEVKVHYENFEHLMTYDQGIILEGWPFKEIKNLSALSSSIKDLENLRSKLNNGSCKLRLLGDDEWTAFREDYIKRVENGDVQEPKRAERSDLGKKRGPKKKSQKLKAVIEIGGPINESRGNRNGDDGDGGDSGGDSENDVGDTVLGDEQPEKEMKGKGSTKAKGAKEKGTSNSGPKPKKIVSKPFVEENEQTTAYPIQTDTFSPTHFSAPTFDELRFPDDDLHMRPRLDPNDTEPNFGPMGPAAKVFDVRDRVQHATIIAPPPEPLFLPGIDEEDLSLTLADFNLRSLHLPSTNLNDQHFQPLPDQLLPLPDPTLLPNPAVQPPVSHFSQLGEPLLQYTTSGDDILPSFGFDIAVDGEGTLDGTQSNKRSRPDVDDLDVPIAERRAVRSRKEPERFADTEYSRVKNIDAEGLRSRKPPSQAKRGRKGK